MSVLARTLVLALSLVATNVGAQSFALDLVKAARERTTHHEVYDGAYRRIPYPMGDVADNRGVCSDVVIRAYRRLGVDLQVLVHEDMLRDFKAYPRTWNLPRPDRNIDHRRVPNLQVFFRRSGAKLAVNLDPKQYAAGDVVTWLLPGNAPHIGIVSDRFVPGTRRPMVIHNIGLGPVEDDSLFRFTISGHYRYRPGAAQRGIPARRATATDRPRGSNARDCRTEKTKGSENISLLPEMFSDPTTATATTTAIASRGDADAHSRSLNHTHISAFTRSFQSADSSRSRFGNCGTCP